jgi:hypothetical protein
MPKLVRTKPQSNTISANGIDFSNSHFQYHRGDNVGGRLKAPGAVRMKTTKNIPSPPIASIDWRIGSAWTNFSGKNNSFFSAAVTAAHMLEMYGERHGGTSLVRNFVCMLRTFTPLVSSLDAQKARAAVASRISQQIMLFNVALKLASDQINNVLAPDLRSKVAAELASVIRACIRAGQQDAIAIAAAAIAELRKSR